MGCCNGCGRDDCTTPYQSIYEISVRDMSGVSQPLSQYQGKVLLIVNVASRCGLTANHYRQLVQLHERYSANGLVILGFPCNQFMRQEPAECPLILDFARSQGAEFQLFDKVDVNGQSAHELFKFLRSHSRLDSHRIGWNFGKFLISREGKILDYFGPRTSPVDMVPDIERLLGS